MTQVSYAVPDPVLPFIGEILDVDTHESIPINWWVDRYGSVVADFVAAIEKSGLPAADTRERDDIEINAENVWKVKRINAPGAFDMKRRLDVLNLTGVKSELMFPGAMGLLSMHFLGNVHNPTVFKSLTGDRLGYARKLIDAYNEWCVRVTAESERYRAVAVLLGDSPDDLVASAKRLISKGVRALWMPSSVLPAGLSPAHTRLDPLWDVLAAANVPLCAHIGADAGFLKTESWRDAPAFEGFRMGEEVSLDPWTLSANHKATENFLATLILGGVFERHPILRYGAAEVCAFWVGPLAYYLDMWIENSGVFSGSKKRAALSLKPSEYIRRNVRVSPFDFEDVGDYIARYGLEEVYCYASDYPHLEGGTNPMGRFCESFKRHGLGHNVLRKFFVENGELLLPN
jgi:hypothetical protein